MTQAAPIRRLTQVALKNTAHHEAGHAVSALSYGVKFRHVTIKPSEDAAGHLLYLRPAISLEQTHHRGIVALAGEAAQRHFNPHGLRRYHGSSDWNAVVDYALEWCGGSSDIANAMVRLWQLQAEACVERQWKTVERLAAALLESQTLTYAESREIFLKR